MRLGPVVFEPWAEVLLDAVGVTAGDRVLDVASGTGVVARAAARRAGPQGRVVGTDVSEPMLSLAAALPLPDDSAPVEYLEARADNLPFPDESFDVVLCQQGLQFFPERLDAAREMHRVLRPGGTLGAAVWAAAHRLEPFDDYAEALAATGVEPPFPRAFDNGTFVMSDEAGRRLFEDAGFATVEVSVVRADDRVRRTRGRRPRASSGRRSDRPSPRCPAIKASAQGGSAATVPAGIRRGADQPDNRGRHRARHQGTVSAGCRPVRPRATVGHSRTLGPPRRR